MGLKIGKDGTKLLACIRAAVGDTGTAPWVPRTHKMLLDREADQAGVPEMYGTDDKGIALISNKGVPKIRYGQLPLTTAAVAVAVPMSDITWPDAFFQCYPGLIRDPLPVPTPAFIAAAKDAAAAIHYCEVHGSKPGGGGEALATVGAFLATVVAGVLLG